MKNKGMTYYSFDSQGKLNGCHYYIADYQGNNRMVVNASTNAIEQVKHYYPYGALIGDISTKPDAQQFKYGGKELDLSDGLNLYDFEARQYDSGAPVFNRPDDHAESYYGISPYAYCAGDPINYIDPTGCDSIFALSPFTGTPKYIGDDGKTTNNVYVVRGKVKREVKAATKKGQNYTGELNDYNNVAVIVRGNGAQQVDKDYTAANGPELGGCVYPDGTVQAWDIGTEPREVIDANGSSAVSHSIAPFIVNGIKVRLGNPVLSWHIHSLLDFKTRDGEVVHLGYSIPSDADYFYEKHHNTGSTFVVGQRDKTVQYYHNGYNTFSFSWKVWKRLAGLK